MTRQQTVVGFTLAEDLLGADNTPYDRSGEEHLGIWATEAMLLLRVAHVRC
jgi:hypothetical protein